MNIAKQIGHLLKAGTKAPPRPIANVRGGSSGIPTYPASFSLSDYLFGESDDSPDVEDLDFESLTMSDDKLKKAQQVPEVIKCLNEIARIVSSAELKVTKKDGEKFLAVEDHPIENIWRRPSKFFSQSMLMSIWVYSMYLTGEAYQFLLPDMDTITDRDFELAEILPMPPGLMEVVAKDKQYIIGYNFYPKGKGADQKPIFYPAEYIIYTRFPNLNDPTFITGMSPLAAASSPWLLDRYQQKWNLGFFSKYSAIPNALITTSPELSDPDFERLRREIFEFFGGGKQRTMIGRGGDVKLQTLGVTQKEMAFLESREMNKLDISGLFGFPEGYWGGTAARGNTTNPRNVFESGTIWPMLKTIAQDWNAQFPFEFVRGIEREQHYFNFKDIRQKDRMLEIQEQKSRINYWTVNEMRKSDDLPALDGEEYDKHPAQLVLTGKMMQPAGGMGGEMGGFGGGNGPSLPPKGGTGKNTPEDGKKPAGANSVPNKGQNGGDAKEDDDDDYMIGVETDFFKWEKKVNNRLKDGKSPAVDFVSDHIPKSIKDVVLTELEIVETKEEAKEIFAKWKLVT